MDWSAEGLLDGLDEEARAARVQLLDALHADGVELPELRRAVAERRLVLLPVERALLGAARYTLAEVADRAGVPAGLVAETRRAAGLSVPGEDELAFGDEDLETLRRLRTYREAGMPDEELLGVIRVMSSSMARVAETMRAMFARALLQSGDTELDLARRLAGTAGALMPLVGPDLVYTLRVQLRELVRGDVLEAGSADLGDTWEVAVAFVDIVGFTRLGEQLPEAELGDVADRLEEMARDRARPPVRLVKTIGDAVMFVSREPRPLVDVLLDLVDAAEADESIPAARGGLAWGPALARMGDWYGATVNMAARVASRARPGSVLATPALKDALGESGDGYDWSFAGDKRLKGLSAPVPTYRVRRRPDG